jgi:hypothetical protein
MFGFFRKALKLTCISLRHSGTMIALERHVGSISEKIVMEIKARAIEYLIVSVNWHNQIVLFCARVVIG